MTDLELRLLALDVQVDDYLRHRGPGEAYLLAQAKAEGVHKYLEVLQVVQTRRCRGAHAAPRAAGEP